MGKLSLSGLCLLALVSQPLTFHAQQQSSEPSTTVAAPAQDQHSGNQPDQVPAMPAYRHKKNKKKKPATEPPQQTTAPAGTASPAEQNKPSVDMNTSPASVEQPAAVPAPVELPNAPSRTLQGVPSTSPEPATQSQTPAAQPPVPAEQPGEPAQPATSRLHILQTRNAYSPQTVSIDDQYGSAYIPVDSWMYPALLRLYSLDYLDTAFLGMRPWTRRSVLHMLARSSEAIENSNNDEAIEIYESVKRELADEIGSDGQHRGNVYGVQSVYARAMEIAGTPLDNSFHLGNTIINDYGRPYASGFNSLAGFSTLNESGRFSLYVRGEYQHAPSSFGFTPAQAAPLFNADEISSNYPYNLSTIPLGPIAAQNPFRIVEANLSAHAFGHEFSFGKSDSWMSPAQGGAFAWSNNAENIYSFRINRVEPLHIPLLSDLLGPVRYDFYVGSLKGHSAPNDPWVHAEKFAFRPTSNFEFGFERTIIWGGKGHAPITIGSFLNGFFSFNDTAACQCKLTRNDPGARFSQFDFSWRLPYLRKWLTFYTDSEVHDDVTPISAPRRAAIRPGLYLSHFPHVPKLDLRAEAAITDASTSRSNNGRLFYWEIVQLQGYTNKGQIFGDWIGREAKGGQAWLTYHVSGNEWLQLAYRNAKTPYDFVPGGTTQNQFTANALVRLRPDVELNGWIQYERWTVPLLKPGPQSDTTATFQLTWYPKLHTK